MLTVAIREAGKTEFTLLTNVVKISLSMVGKTLVDARLWALENPEQEVTCVDLFDRSIATIEIQA